ncbi:MAG: DUF1579 family protein [Planctomycetes bacterium]|nr:DUF1579 family protein [Planctomycetota bacterium]
MKLPLVSALLVLCAAGALTLSSASSQGESENAMAEMMAKAERWTKPGEHHKLLEKFVGKWNTEVRMFMGGQATPPEKGTAECTWLMPGRWIQCRSNGQMMRMPMETFFLMGYDNFKMSYVTTALNSMDTMMLHFEGDMTPDGKSLVSYGTLDEYLTGEHDKMVKTAWRFIDADTMVFEVHDLPIGEVNAKVFEIKYMRSK